MGDRNETDRHDSSIPLSLVSALWAQLDLAMWNKDTRMLITTDSKTVAPALDKYAEGTLAGLWKRPDLKPRDRSIVTLAALIARNQPALTCAREQQD